MNDWASVLGMPLWAWLFVMPTIIAVFSYTHPVNVKRILTPIWRYLDKVYTASGALAAICMVLILLIIVMQMIARWSSVSFQGSTEFAGYAMAATSFFCVRVRVK